jgi:hypothetical protein
MYTFTVTRRDDHKVYKKVFDFDLQETYLILFIDAERVKRIVIPLVTALEIEIEQEESHE